MFFGGTRVQIAMISAVRVAHRDLTSLMRRIGRVRVPAALAIVQHDPPAWLKAGRAFCFKPTFWDFFAFLNSAEKGASTCIFGSCFLVLKQY